MFCSPGRIEQVATGCFDFTELEVHGFTAYGSVSPDTICRRCLYLTQDGGRPCPWSKIYCSRICSICVASERRIDRIHPMPSKYTSAQSCRFFSPGGASIRFPNGPESRAYASGICRAMPLVRSRHGLRGLHIRMQSMVLYSRAPPIGNGC